MRRVGPFEIERDLYRRGFWTVSVASRAGDTGPARYAVKWMERPDDVLGPARAEALAVEFLKAAEAQRLACASGGEHWAGVEDYGRSDGGVFVAWSLRPRTAADLSAGRFIFDDESAPWLKGLVLGVLDALREVRDGAGRGHGNLKPGNVLLATRNAWTPADVALCDPAPDPPRGGQHADLVALGRLIHRLVLHREFAALGGWPIQRSEAWNRLGRGAGEAWREVCARLLDPNAPVGSLRIEEIRAAVEAIPTPWSRRKRARVKGGLGVAAALVLAVVGWQGYIIVDRAMNPFDPVQWRELCEACDDWLLPLSDAVASLDDESRARWQGDDYLRAHVLPVVQNRRAIDPAEIARRRGVAARRDLVDLPARQTRGYGRETREAHSAMTSIADALASPEWALPGSLESAAAALAARGWDAPASDVRRLAAGLRAPPGPGLGERIDRALRAAALPSQIETSLARIETGARAASSTGAPGFADFGDAARRALDASAGGEDALSRLSDALREYAAVGDRLASFVERSWPTIDRAALDGHSRLIAALRAGERSPDAAFYADLVAEASREEFRALPPESNPTRSWEARARISRVLSGLEGARGSPDADGAVRARIDALAERGVSIGAKADEAAGMAWNSFTRERVAGLVRDVEGDVASLERDYAGVSEEIAALERAWVQRERTASGRLDNPALNTEWARRRDQLMAEYDANGDYRALRSRLRALTDTLNGLVEAAAGTIRFNPPDALLFDAAPLIDALRLRAGNSAEPALRIARWEDGAYSNPEEMARVARESVQALREWHAAVEAIFAEMLEVQRGIQLLHLLSEPAGSSGPIESVLARCMARPEFAEIDGPRAFARIVAWVEELRRLGAETDRGTLARVARAGGTSPAASYAAWRRLGELGWPASVAELNAEADARDAVSVAVASVPDGPRRGVLNAELDAEGHERWSRCAAALRTEQDFAACVGFLPRFPVQETRLDERLRYNLALHRFRAAITGRPSDEEAERAAAVFVADSRALGAGLARPALALDAASAVESTVRSWKQGPPRVNFSAVGPGTLGWHATPDARDETVTLEWRGERRSRSRGAAPKLTFVRVDASGEAVYVATEEVSLSLMQGWLDAEAWTELTPILVPTSLQNNDVWSGPRLWSWPSQPRNGLVWKRGRPSQQDDWLPPNVEVSAATPQYAAGIGDPADPMRIAPNHRTTEQHPVQHVTPVGALRFAQALNCRLPTEAEWIAALRRYEDPAMSGWNLRDRTFARQRDHVAGIIADRAARGVVRVNFRHPDDGVFVPEGATVARGAEAGALETDDGVLWFQQVERGPGRTLKHLIGNVAEFVLMDAGGDRFGVIGGSALSPPELALDRAYEIPARQTSDATYADVGFRLAFSAGEAQVPLAAQLAQAIQGAGFDLGD
ncbi:MAG: SUMF1/EgtB/PvdO family nonheme iron enzyme [Phycisphaerales bacterium]|nr:SUMF1/EgtB/PvdO family nonheme iron enzyme [Phycisphaerales bacterium]